MWKRGLVNILIPTLFVLVAIVVSLFTVDISRHETKIIQAEIEEITKVEVVIEKIAPPENLISPYDPIFMEVANKHKLDWLLLAAIANVESRFRPNVKSHMGAIGLMQVMPHVAKSMGYDPKQLLDPQINVEIAAQILQENKKMLRLSKRLPEEEKLKFLLACYNAGYSRVADARNLADYFDSDIDDWKNDWKNDWEIVAFFMSWLSDPEFTELKIVQSGTFNGSDETITYVDKVLRIYNEYRKNIAK